MNIFSENTNILHIFTIGHLCEYVAMWIPQCFEIVFASRYGKGAVLKPWSPGKLAGDVCISFLYSRIRDGNVFDCY